MTAVPPAAERTAAALALVRRALDIAPEARAAWIGCEIDDAALREEVLALLALDATPAHPIEALHDGLPEPDDPLPGTQLGPYRLGERIGSGGMGSVYRAEPTAGVTRRPVALKLVKRGMDSEEVLRRFLREREILARLEHPHIARLLDGGIADDGRPWFAMELVDGEPLLAWCDRHAASIPDRVRCFLDVCDAVAHAHRSLVVHRDIKPSNVLATRAGDVKLLDFGIAKLLEDDVGTRSRAPMTPEYAAPEQLASGVVTTQTDVFQLGALLHELLCGLRPDRAGEAHAEWTTAPRLDACLRALGQRDPERLRMLASARLLAPAGLQRMLAGDLARIVRRAMHTDPARRYGSVGALADDLQRWLRGDPVSATDDTWAYRARCFVRRNRLAVAALAGVLASLAIGLGYALFEAEQARRAEQRAERALSLLEDVFLGADPYASRGADTRAADLLARASARVHALVDTDPAFAARLLAGIGSAYVSLDERAAAEAALTAAVRAGERAGAAARVDTASARARLAHYALVIDGRPEALADLEQAIEALRAAAPQGRAELAHALRLLTDHLFNQGRFDAIPALSAEAVALARAASGEASAEHALALAVRASLLRATGHEAEALEVAMHADRVMQALGDAVPPATRLYVMQQHAGALSAAGQVAEAAPVLQQALDAAIALNGADSSLAIGLAWEVASTAAALGDFDVAALRLRELHGRMGQSKSANVAAVLNALGSADLGRGDADAAIASFDAALALVCSGEGGITAACTAVRLNRLDAWMQDGRSEAARAELDRLDRELPRARGAARDRWQRLQAQWWRQRGDVDAAERAFAPLTAVLDDADAGGIDVALVLVEAGRLAEARGDRARALSAFRRAEQQMSRTWRVAPRVLLDLRQTIRRLEHADPIPRGASAPSDARGMT